MLKLCVPARVHAPRAAKRSAPCRAHPARPAPRVRSYEGQRDQLYSQQFNIEQTSFTLQSMEDTRAQARNPALPRPRARP